MKWIVDRHVRYSAAIFSSKKSHAPGAQVQQGIVKLTVSEVCRHAYLI